MNIYVSPVGNDEWSGRFPEPNVDKTDGPLATITRARNLIRKLKFKGTFPIIVWIRGGRYPISEPIIFGPEDSLPVTYAAYHGEQPIIDGGQQIKGWKVEKRGAKKVWVVDISEVAEGKWYFRQLFVNGERRPRVRLPKKGFFRIENVPGYHIEKTAPSDTFQCRPGDIRKWKNLPDVEVVILHSWREVRIPITSFTEDKKITRFYVENVFEALSEPGEWYLNRASGRLYYMPLPEEDPEKTEIYAPRTEQLLKLVGSYNQDVRKIFETEYVKSLRFEGITFQHAKWDHPAEIAPQAAHNIPGVIYMEGAHCCAIEDCKIKHVGGYGIEVADGCIDNRIVGNEIFDLGAGGVKLNGADAHGSRERRTGNNKVTDNHIRGGGRVFHSAVGILSMHSFGNNISHNHIHDFYYSGISCGWVWSYRDNVSKDNFIEKNHVHDIGQGLLSDMGGIYTLGVQPGTVIRGNVVHDIKKYSYGAWGIYPDGASSHILVENNICYNCQTGGFLVHYGRENIVRNNIFVFLEERGQIGVGLKEAHKEFTFIKNIVVVDNQPLFVGGGDKYEEQGLISERLISDLNLFWDISGKQVISSRNGAQTFDFSDWRKLGQDLHSIIADPCFKDLKKFDFTLMDDSPALGLGFKPIDTSDVGPRSKNKRE
jgi:parallel beta-helix repeat protein